MPLNPPKKLKRRFFQHSFRLVHRNYLIFGTKVNLDNTYTLAILNFVGKILIPLNPLKKQKIKLIWDESRDPASRAYYFWCLDGVDGPLHTYVPIFPKLRALEFSDFWSLDQLLVETVGVASVHTSIRRYATLFLGNRSLFFLKLYS